MEPKAGKRMVSKGAYVKMQGERGICRLLGYGFFVSAILCVLLACWCVFLIVSGRFLSENMTTNDATSIPMLMILVPLTYLLYQSGQNAFARAASIPNVTPLTRAKTAGLPVSDSLVRASSEPMQAQEAVLLRATTEGQATPPEQLVRPTESRCRETMQTFKEKYIPGTEDFADVKSHRYV